MRLEPHPSDIFVWPDGDWQYRSAGLVHGSRADFTTLHFGTLAWVEFVQALKR